jgi:hypothetical protein
MTTKTLTTIPPVETLVIDIRGLIQEAHVGLAATVNADLRCCIGASAIDYDER